VLLPGLAPTACRFTGETHSPVLVESLDTDGLLFLHLKLVHAMADLASGAGFLGDPDDVLPAAVYAQLAAVCADTDHEAVLLKLLVAERLSPAARVGAAGRER